MNQYVSLIGLPKREISRKWAPPLLAGKVQTVLDWFYRPLFICVLPRHLCSYQLRSIDGSLDYWRITLFVSTLSFLTENTDDRKIA